MDKKKKRALRLHRLMWRIVYLPFFILCRLFFNYRFKPAGHIPSPYIVVANHSNAWDPFLTALAFGPGGHMYFLASEHIFRDRLTASVINRLAAPISRTKGGSDASAVMTMLRLLKSGVSVCLFPEGENCFNGRTGRMHPATAKLLKKAGVTMVTFRITGGHLSLPRWAHS
ncbi:MAG: 1-acyl-sn-glycerol-3-phosphate acyltransferase, partial [Oscillospiraceae bacterium]|nr:1-acyl-sn-glycerol-3-phosphate acyltransferase [Oscillospiraceae bacterium]